MKRNKQKLALLCGLLGCLCYGGGDWLMMYGDPGHAGALIWLTNGTAHIPLWRYDLAMALALPGILLYGIALFAVETCIRGDRERRIYHYLNAFGLTPWIALHLFYIMILVLFSWMNANGFAAEALTVCEGLFSRLSWLVPVSEAMMLPVFVYWFYLQITGKTAFPKAMAFTNVLILFAVLKGISLLLPVSAFRLGFTNGLMSESMILWFSFMLIWEGREKAMDKYLKIFEPAMKKWLAEHYSPEEAQKRWERTVALDEKWLREEGDLGGRKNPMANNMLEAYAFFAFYDSVDRSFSPEDLHSMIDAAMGKSIRMLSHFDMNKLLRRRGIVKLFYRYLENYQKKAERFRGNAWGNTWKIRINPDEHEKGLAFVYDTCPLNDFARRHGYIDFLPNLCYIDQITCSAAHGKLIRHKTLADGDGECNYWILGDKEPEALADAGSK